MTFFKNTAEIYRLVYRADEDNTREIAIKLAEYIQASCHLRVEATPEGGIRENTILLGTASLAVLPSGEALLEEKDAYISGVFGNTYVIYSNDRLGLAVAAQIFIERLSAQSDMIKLNACENITSKVSDLVKDCFYKNAVVLARKLYDTYGSWVSRQLTQMEPADQIDQKLVDTLIDLMGNSFSVSVGSSSALYHGYVVKLDPVDYKKITKISDNGNIMVASHFACEYFAHPVRVDSEGYVDLNEACAANAHTLSFFPEVEIAVVTPIGEHSFADRKLITRGFTNAQYLERMEAFFHNPILPEPSINVEQTRKEIESNIFDSAYVYDYTTEIYNCFASPAILTIGKTMYVSYEFTPMSMENYGNKAVGAIAYLKRSKDNGKTWEKLGEVEDMIYGSLVELNGKIYLMGNRRSNANVIVAVFDPSDNSFQYADLGFTVMGTAPTAIAVANGRIWRAHNYAVISADTTKDLLKPENWMKSESPNAVMRKEDFESMTGETVTGRFWLEEGNMVVGKDGELYAIYRIDASPSWGRAAIFKMSSDGKKLIPVDTNDCIGKGLVKFPSGQSKFMIKYDEETGMYLSLTSLITNGSPHQRNVLALVASKDLFQWDVVDVLLVERKMMNKTLSMFAHSFQYVDFVTVGKDLCFIVRESVGDSCNYHNANAITLYTLSDYASFIQTRLS